MLFEEGNTDSHHKLDSDYRRVEKSLSRTFSSTVIWSLVIQFIVEVIISDQIHIWGTSLEVQSSGLHTSTSGGTSSISGWATRSYMLCSKVKKIYVFWS